MKKLVTIGIVVLVMVFAATANAKKPKKTVTPAGPEPLITVYTDCVRASDGVMVNRYFSDEIPPNMKNDALSLAIGIADFQTNGLTPPDGPSQAKSECVVTRFTPSGIEQVVYTAYAE